MQIQKIIIIGAGAAGISAATKLFEAGFHNLIILEAENRIGGRINTIPFGRNVVDMGAQWCHGEVNNVVFELAKPHNFFDSSTTQNDRFNFVRSNGEFVSQDIGIRLFQLAMTLMENYSDELKVTSGSLGDFLIQKFYSQLEQEEYNDIDREMASQFLDFFQRYECLSNASSTWFDLSAEGSTQYQWCEGNLYLNWKDKGFRTIFDLLMKKIPDPKKALPIEEKIQFNKVVSNIHWSRSPDTSVRVTCSDGSVIDADHVIVTASLGVLKEKYLTLFTPELPIIKTNAIQGLGMGTVDKIYLEFKKSFWDANFHGFSLLWNKVDHTKMLKNEQFKWLVDVLGFYPVDYQPSVLCAWISGNNAIKMEMLSDAVVQEGLLMLMKIFLTSYNIPKVVRLERSRWNSNPNFRGSYSYRSIATDLMRTSAADLALPLTNALGIPVLQFAGEATHDYYYSTVNGAIETGWREASRIIELYCK